MTHLSDGLCVVPRRCEVCHRENAPLRTTRGFGILRTVERCVDAAACFAAWSSAQTGASDG